MDSEKLLELIELLQQESAARKAEQASRAAAEASLLQTISDLNSMVKHLNTTIAKLIEENRLLKSPKKNSGNSSVPPSKDENRPQKTSSLRSSSGKSAGGQAGHEGSTLKMSSMPDNVVNHKPHFCKCCGLGLQDQKAELVCHRQVIDIPPVKPVYTEHRQYRKVCCCGHQNLADFPVGVDAPVSYGSNTQALIAYLHTRQYIPFGRISEYFRSVYAMPISQGTVYGIINRFAAKAQPAVLLIKNALLRATVIGSDETGAKQNGKQNWFWTWQSKQATFIAYSHKRDLQTIQTHFPTGFPKAVLTHDCWNPHFKTQALNHQICTAHLLREMVYMEQKYASEWATEFKQMIYSALQLKKNMEPCQYHKPVAARSELEKQLQELLMVNMHQKNKELIAFQKRILKHREYLFTFLYHHEVPADNNKSEQAIRNIKVKQKVSGMFKSAHGAHSYAIIRSVTDTCIKNSQCIINAFAEIAKLKHSI